MDVAFLNAKLNEDVYIEPPAEYNAVTKGMVLKLIKALYGLKQSPREWTCGSCLRRRIMSEVQRSISIDRGGWIITLASQCDKAGYLIRSQSSCEVSL